MPPLITREEALALGEIEDHTQIEALITRAWEARVERFGDSTDMCSLVNAKSGGCAEDCGFCAQSRFAEAETPMHAMMEPEQILEHARAAEEAGAHRFCMVTQGQGLSKRDFEKYLEGVRLVSEHTNLKRCASVGHISAARATALREAGIQRVHHNVETSSSYYDEVTSTVRYEGRLRTIQAVREAGLAHLLGVAPGPANGFTLVAGAAGTPIILGRIEDGVALNAGRVTYLDPGANPIIARLLNVAGELFITGVDVGTSALNINPPAGATAAAIFFGANTLTSAAATAGANGAPPAQVSGYLQVFLGGATRKIPYYNV